MIEQSDVQGRLRLFRYGLVVVVVVAFLVSLLTPIVALRDVPQGVNTPGIGDHLLTALLITVVVAVIAVIAYIAYHYVLTQSLPWGQKAGQE